MPGKKALRAGWLLGYNRVFMELPLYSWNHLKSQQLVWIFNWPIKGILSFASAKCFDITTKWCLNYAHLYGCLFSWEVKLSSELLSLLNSGQLFLFSFSVTSNKWKITIPFFFFAETLKTQRYCFYRNFKEAERAKYSCRNKAGLCPCR